MDFAAAIGVVSGILSFVTFASKLVKGAVEIYRQGSLDENSTLEDVVDRIDRFHANLGHTLSKPHGMSDEERDLCALAEECRRISTELLRLLRSMRPSGSKGRRAKWNALGASWNSILYAKDKAELEARLNNCQTKLITILTWSSRLMLQNVTTATEKSNVTLQQLQSYLEELRSELKLREKQPDWLDASVQKIISNIETQEATVRRVAQHRVLQALQYDRMRDRYNDVEDRVNEIQKWLRKEGGTFRWLFESAPTDNTAVSDEELAMMRSAREKIEKWLYTDGGIFHISGILGCGKSTLMQLLYTHPFIQTGLEKWAGNRKLVKTSYFFSVVVGGRQQLLAGLYRTLLHDILVQSPELTPLALPKLWNEVLDLPWQATDTSFDISNSVIEMALRDILYNEKYANYCFCLFIDALDEYQDGEGQDQADLVNLLHEWAPSTQVNRNVKLCVASRPEPVFQNKFPEATTFHLHEVTRYDMQRYVACRLPDFDENLRNQLVKEIPEKAQGIFLWTHLVVREIREDWEVTHDLDMKVLDRFPAGLRPLLDRTVASIRERHRQRAYLTLTMLLLMMEYRLALTTVQYSFLDDYCREPSFAYTMPVTDWRDVDKESKGLQSKIQERMERGVKQLHAWCKGLVVVVPWNDNKFGEISIQHLVFLHRSILDYFQNPQVKGRLLDIIGINSPPEAVSETLSAEFSFSTTIYRLQGREERYWAQRLLDMRSHSGMDTAPYRFLNRMQTVFELTQLAHLTEITEDEDMKVYVSVGSTDLGYTQPVGYVKFINFCLASPLLFSIFRLPSNPLYLSHVASNSTAVKWDGFMPVVMSWALITTILQQGPLSPTAFETFTALCGNISGCIDIENWFHPYVPLPDDHYFIEFEGKTTVWQQYLLAELVAMRILSFGHWSKIYAVQFGQIVEGFLLAGADPHCWVSLVRQDEEDEEEEEDEEYDSHVLQMKMGCDRQKVIRALPMEKFPYFPLPFEPGPIVEWPLREWIDMCDIPNKSTLLALIDKRLSTADMDHFLRTMALPGSWKFDETQRIETDMPSDPAVDEIVVDREDITEHLITFLTGSLFTAFLCSFIFL
ncbi:hypothetical protein QBC41DRAFT_324721 [Cercophora samala]|uniref:NACHT domain-containing protein n=1 Tax=Cercophora samala TaxID=330535 RepID=A0AA40DB31_9PEZI|nr:hypothetical protein QBC41DRAFT_324721 [Cercophora samala]